MDLYSKEEIEKKINNDIECMNLRFNEMITLKNNNSNIDIEVLNASDFIKENYKKEVLVYDNAHPKKEYFHFICEKIVKILNIENTINYNINPLISEPNYDINILYKCIEKVVDFEVSYEKLKINNKIGLTDVLNSYYNEYKNYDINELKKLIIS